MGVVNSVMSFFGFGSSDGNSESAPRPKQPAPRPRRAADMSEIVTLDPESYADAKEVAAHFRSGVPVIGCSIS
jgi:FtsZ-interacting cell division protein YlmF